MSATLAIAPMIFVRQFRLWAAAKAKGEHPLPYMQEAASLFGTSPELSVACASLFDLVETQLGRHLQPECCCSSSLSRDEQALIGVLRHAPESGQPITNSAIPHGLPGAICWAAFAIRRSLGETFAEQFEIPGAQTDSPSRCPFTMTAEVRLQAVA